MKTHAAVKAVLTIERFRPPLDSAARKVSHEFVI
jgi:hypothetical protein